MVMRSFDYDNDSDIKDLLTDGVAEIIEDIFPIVDQYKKWELSKRYSKILFSSIETSIGNLKDEASLEIDTAKKVIEELVRRVEDLEERAKELEEEKEDLRMKLEEPGKWYGRKFGL